MIRIHELNKSFGDFQALHDLSLHVPKGAVYGLVGPNGAGKSTVIRHIIGSYRPDSGCVLVNGYPVWESCGVKEVIGCIPDDFYFPVSACLEDMVKYYKRFYPTFDPVRFEALAEAFPEIAGKRRRPLRGFSKGMQKQAAFWLVISCRPKVLVLDEPVDGLDPIMRRQVWSLMLSDVAENNTTVLVSSHNLRELEDVCDHVGVLDHGKLLLQRSLNELQSNIHKVQIVLSGTESLSGLPEGMELLHRSSIGRVQTLIVRGEEHAIRQQLEQYHPVILDLLPLTLEEIFIYELGGQDYAVKDILV